MREKLKNSQFQCNKNDDYLISFHIELQVFDSQGICVIEFEQPMEISEKIEPDYVWLYFWIETNDFKGGDYTVHITITDTVSRKRGTTKGTFFILEGHNNAEDYILEELGGEIAQCKREKNFHMCHLLWWDNYKKIGEIWIYYYFEGTHEDYPFKIGIAKRKIVGGANNEVVIYIGGNEEFLAKVCALYNEKFGFTCVEFKIP